MEEKESNPLEERRWHHTILMKAVLRKVSDTPLILKGGNALHLGYGSERFSEDLDFDSAKKLNLSNKIRSISLENVAIDNVRVKKDTETVSRYLIEYHIKNTGRKDFLKVEISYRTTIKDVVVKDGIRLSKIENLIDNKLRAAFDGENTRVKARDLFDLHFLAKNYSQVFNSDLAKRLKSFTSEPDKLYSIYEEDLNSDPELKEIMDLESVVLELSELASNIFKKTASKPAAPK